MVNKYLILVMTLFAVPHHAMMSAPAVESTARPLENLGNSCFLNALMQCFFSLPSMKNSLEAARYRQPENQFIYSLALLQNRLDRRFPLAFHYGITIPFLLGEIRTKAMELMFPGDAAELEAQQDPSELAGLIIQAINSVTRFPSGEICITTICDGNHALQRVAPATMFNLNLAPSIQEALYNTEEVETLNGANQYACSACPGPVDATRVTEIKPAPELLIVRLLRESYDLEALSPIKNNAPIKVEEGVVVDRKSYLLTGMILHQGEGANSGHYIALVRDIAEPEQWFLCNDEMITDGNEAIEAYYAGRTYSLPVMGSVAALSKEDAEDEELAAVLAASLGSNHFDVAMLFYQGHASAFAASLAAASGSGGK